MCKTTEIGSASSTVFIENQRTRVTEWRFLKRDDNTGWHRHDYDYVVVPLFDGTLKIRTEDGNLTQAPMLNGIPYFREKGVEHDVINDNDFECAFVEIEFIR
ncbi:MAG: cupin [Gammaproteobacteria bacterium]|nr:cupin [Gammaproteobacteria bacterium]